MNAVFEWDSSSHGYAYQLWEKAILSDGGEGCRKKIEMTGEPLIEGMLVGTEKDILNTSETHQVLHSLIHTFSVYECALTPLPAERRQISLRK
jgi:hypothetical protein